MNRTMVMMLVAPSLVGCAAVVEPGHRGLEFGRSGLRPEVLAPGHYYRGFLGTGLFWPGRVDDFDVTYSTREEKIATVSVEGLELGMDVSVIFRPIISELYALDTEIGPNYYEEVVGPEFRSSARGVFARHSYQEMQKQTEKLEDEIETELRRRIRGKHIEVTSVTIVSSSFAPDIGRAVQAKLVAEQDAARQKTLLENEALRKRLELEQHAEEERLRAEATLKEKEREQAIATAQAAIDKLHAETESETKLLRAKAQAEETKILAKAEAEHRKAQATTLTPLMVQMAGYEALAKLGGTGTTVLLGDWSHVPSFLFPLVAGAAAK